MAVFIQKNRFYCQNLRNETYFQQMSAVGITENAKGDNKKFEIWCNSREEVYIVQVSTYSLYWLN